TKKRATTTRSSSSGPAPNACRSKAPTRWASAACRSKNLASRASGSFGVAFAAQTLSSFPRTSASFASSAVQYPRRCRKGHEENITAEDAKDAEEEQRVTKHEIGSSRGAMNILAELKKRFSAALAGQVDDAAELVELVRPSQDPKFGDYQANFAMPLGKRLGRPPRDVAAEVVSRLKVDDLCEPPQVEGPGFINLRIKDSWLEAQLGRALADERLGVDKVARPRTYVIDYSAPNVA